MKEAIVIAVHDSYGSGVLLQPIIKHLRSASVYCNAIILPGHEKPLEEQKKVFGNTTLKDYVRYVEQVVQKNLLQHPRAKIILVGHSLGTSVIDSVIAKDPEKYRGVVYLAPTAGLSLFGFIKLCLHYSIVFTNVVFGVSHTIPFYIAKKKMMNKTPIGKAGAIYEKMTYESGKVLREVFFFRKNVKNSVPKLFIFGENDKTITKSVWPNSYVVDGDHISMINNSKELVLEFIEHLMQNES